MLNKLGLHDAFCLPRKMQSVLIALNSLSRGPANELFYRFQHFHFAVFHKILIFFFLFLDTYKSHTWNETKVKGLLKAELNWIVCFQFVASFSDDQTLIKLCFKLTTGLQISVLCSGLLTLIWGRDKCTFCLLGLFFTSVKTIGCQSLSSCSTSLYSKLGEKEHILCNVSLKSTDQVFFI